MDTITHGLVGYAIYRLGRPAAPAPGTERPLLWGTVLAAELPDVDMVSALAGSGASLVWHRAWTHSFVGVAALAALLALLMLRRWPALERGRLFLLTLAAGLSHVIIDLFTSYGTKLLLPWSDVRYALDVMPLTDPVLLALLAAFVWAGRRGAARAALWLLVAAMLAYGGWRTYVHEAAVAQVRAALPAATEAAVMPVLGGLTKWRFAAVGPEGFTGGYVEYGGATAPDLFVPDAAGHPAVRAAAETETMGIVRGFARFVAFRVEREGELWHVTGFDPRWAQPGRRMFAGHVWLDGDLRVIREEIRQRD